MLKLKLQYFGHLMWRTDSLEKTLMLGKIEGGRRRGQQTMSWLDGIQLDGHDFQQAPGVGDGQGSLACCSPWGHKESDTTKQLNWTELRMGMGDSQGALCQRGGGWLLPRAISSASTPGLLCHFAPEVPCLFLGAWISLASQPCSLLWDFGLSTKSHASVSPSVRWACYSCSYRHYDKQRVWFTDRKFKFYKTHSDTGRDSNKLGRWVSKRKEDEGTPRALRCSVSWAGWWVHRVWDGDAEKWLMELCSQCTELQWGQASGKKKISAAHHGAQKTAAQKALCAVWVHRYLVLSSEHTVRVL